MRWTRVWAAWLVGVVCLVGVACPGVVAAPPAAAAGGWPVSGPVVRGFDPPEVRWGSGHRGVDVAAEAGAVVSSPADGVVSFVGVVAGRPVLVVTHGDLRTTLEPVTASVAVGRAVAAGDAIGRLEPGHVPCPTSACLHWGLKRGEEYLDPLSLVAGPLRLVPASAADEVEDRARRREEQRRLPPGPDGPGPDGGGILARPSAGRVTSVFGMRFHPIFKEWRMHNGIDLSTSCGTPIHAAEAGVVAHMGYDSSGGWRLVVAHGPLGGADLQTVYLHAQGYRVRAGDRVTRGEFVGTVGSTGWSTGCHLHFGVKADGRHTDPLPWLG